MTFCTCKVYNLEHKNYCFLFLGFYECIILELKTLCL